MRDEVADDDIETCSICNEPIEQCYCPTCEKCGEVVESVCDHCECCEDHCGCQKCYNCLGAVREICSNCDCCCYCCDCSQCGGCGSMFDSVCSECERCEDCCTCENDEDALPFFNYHGDDWHTQAKNLKYTTADKLKAPEFLRERRLGLELELSVAPHEMGEFCNAWGIAVTEDGSLNNGGRELVTVPLYPIQMLRFIKAFGMAAKENSAEANERCGLHVHVGVADHTASDIQKFLILYSKVEDQIYKMCKSRRYNDYCIPWGHLAKELSECSDKDKFREKLVTGTLYKCSHESGPKLGSEVGFSKGRKYHESRYRGLNLHSYYYRRTLEFRMFSGSTDPEYIAMAAELCISLVESAYRATQKQLVAMPHGCLLQLPCMRPELKNNIEHFLGEKACAE